jgi:hypothetical protein
MEMIKVITRSKDLFGAAILRVEVGTTGMCGGDSGHGCRTYLRFGNESGDWTFSATEDCLVLNAGGDSELLMLIEGLEFALAELKAGTNDGTSADVPTVGKREVE